MIKRAKEAGVVLVAFDNILDTTDAINVNVDQKGLGELWGNWLVKHMPDGGKILEVRGVAGTSVDTDRHKGIHEVFAASGKNWEVIEVVGKWDDGTAQKVTADAIATRPFDGITVQGGYTGIVQAMIDAGHAFVPFGGETENGFRKFCGAHSAEGLKCSSAGTGPAQVAVAIKTAHRRPRRRGGAAIGPAAARHRRGPGLQGRRELLRRPVGQFLRRQRLPDLRHQLHRPGDHGPDGSQPVDLLSRKRRAAGEFPAACSGRWSQ